MENILKFVGSVYVHVMYMQCLNILNELTCRLPRCSMRANYPEFDAGELRARARQISVLTG